ncbi:MAG: hypothetical protein JWQ76_3134 [Ramlibacter sp.]|nr:hypothetical protein [Ramlibacter sp.]
MSTDPAASPRALSAPARWLLLGLAWLCILLGIVGIILPVMPTVPFLLVAAWAASRSSPRLHHWLHTHPRFGVPLRNWEDAQVVPRSAKWIATVMMSASAASLLTVTPQKWMLAAVAVVAAMAALLYWLWRRPERRPDAGN